MLLLVKLQMRLFDSKSSGIVRVEYSPIMLFYDSSGAIAQSKELRNHKRMKHIERKYILIRQIVIHEKVTMENIASTENLPDPFAKILPYKTFELHLDGCVTSMQIGFESK